MRQNRTRSIALALTLLLMLTAGCAKTPAATATPTPSATPTADAAPQVSAQQVTVNLGLLKGPTGMGAAKLMADNDAKASALQYNVTLAAQPTELTAKLISGELDMAALPTNVAAALYNKTQGDIQLLALNTLGVLQLLENGETVKTLADLKGQTVYATGQGANPEYVFNYLLRQKGLEPGKDVTIVWKTADEVSALMASGEAKLALLPVPAATAVLMKSKDVRAAIDLNDAWKDAGAAGTFTMGCIAVRRDFIAKSGADAIASFLTEYAASIDYVNQNADAAAELMVQYEIIPKAPIAKAAIPQANLVCITGQAMKDINSYYEVLFAADPTAIGGKIPDDAFFYAP